MKRVKKRHRLLKKLLKIMSKGYYKDFDDNKTTYLSPDESNDHTVSHEVNDHTNPLGVEVKQKNL